MNEHNGEPVEEHEDQRQRAEHKLGLDMVSAQEMTEADMAVVVHELRVHQIELEMQNEELRKTQTELEQSRGRYADLFDFAPVGYLVFNSDGLVLEANLTACFMLGQERARLVNQPFSLLVAPASRDA